MPRAPYWVFGSWVQPTGWVLVAVGVLVSVAAAALIVHHHRRGVPVAASAAVVFAAVSRLPSPWRWRPPCGWCG